MTVAPWTFRTLKNKVLENLKETIVYVGNILILDTDASFEVMEDVPSQKNDNGRAIVIAHGPYSLNAHEKRYCAYY